MFNGYLAAVDHVTFEVKEGEIFGFLGPNRAGKNDHNKHVITV